MVSSEWLKRTNGITNYATLVDQIRHFKAANEMVCLVSFNYDVILDRTISVPMFKLFKPHGSVDWARFVAGPTGTRYVEVSKVNQFYDAPSGPRCEPQQLIDQAPNLILSDQYVRANATDPTQMFKFNWPIVPAIAIPVQTKTEDTFEWPDDDRRTFEQLLPHVTQILIIGWQGKEAHFLKLLREKLPTGGLTQITHLQVVGKDQEEGRNISEQFTNAIGRDVKKVNIPTLGGFSHFVQVELVNFFFKD
jgi:hypothetical protein